MSQTPSIEAGTDLSEESSTFSPIEAPPATGPDDSSGNDVVYLMAVAFKEAALDSPTFRASMNHLDVQFESLDRWIESFTKAINRMTAEMDGR